MHRLLLYLGTNDFSICFPKYGIKVQMSNLTFEKLTKDDECPADIKMNGYPGS